MSASVPSERRLVESTALAVLTAVALVCGIVIGIWSLFIDGSDDYGRLLRAGLAWWSSLMLIIATIGGVGAMILSGVRTLLRRRDG